MKNIKFFSLICFFSIFIFSCATFNISATDNNVSVDARKALNFESVIKKAKKSVVILAVSPDEDPTINRNQSAMCSGACLLYTSPSPRDATLSRMPSSA